MAAMVKFGFTAEQIINEKRVTEHEINQIRNWMKCENLPNITDEQIVLFLISCCNDWEATKKTVATFYEVRKDTPELFNNRKICIDDLQKQLNVLKYCVLPERTADGCVILYQSLQDGDYRNYVMEPAVKLLFMTLEAAFYDHPPDGLIILFDVKGTSIMHLTKMKIKLAQSYVKYLQECLPIRLKRVHVFNSLNVISTLLNILKPFLKKEVKDALHLHAPDTDMEHFAETWIPKTHLPEDLGGYLPSTDVLHKQNIQKLLEMESYFDAEEMQRSRWIESVELN